MSVPAHVGRMHTLPCPSHAHIRPSVVIPSEFTGGMNRHDRTPGPGKGRGRPLRDSERNQCVARMRRKILRISEATSTMAARPMHSSHAIGGSGVVPNAVLSHGT